jgi:hypothetical protein
MLAQRAGEEFAVEVPDGEAVGFRLQLGMEAGLGAERVEIGNQVAAHAEGVDQLHDGRLLGDLGVARAGHAGQQRLAVDFPVHRLVRHAEVFEDLFVEAVLAVEQVLQFAQKRARFGALNDAVVVGAAQRHHLADAQDGARFRRRAAILRRDNRWRRRR